MVDVGLLPAPMIYYARRRLAAEGCAIVTGSHEPADINGLKWLWAIGRPLPDDVSALQRSVNGAAGSRRRPQPQRAARLDVSFDYVASLQETFVESMATQQHVVHRSDARRWAGKARRYFHAMFPQCLFSTVHDDGRRPIQRPSPDWPARRELHELCDAVYRERAGLGIAFDGDGDRIALVDDEGVLLSPEETAWVLLQSLGDELRGQPFVYDLKFSDRMAEAARQFGAEPIAERSGHAFIAARMIETNAVFGAELSGHYFYRSIDGGDDALYTACRLIAYLARSGQTLAELRRSCPPIYMTPDLRIADAAGRAAAGHRATSGGLGGVPAADDRRSADRHARRLGLGAKLGDGPGADVPLRGPRLARVGRSGRTVLCDAARMGRRSVGPLSGSHGRGGNVNVIGPSAQGQSVFRGVGVAVALPPLNCRRFRGWQCNCQPNMRGNVNVIGPSAGVHRTARLGRAPVSHWRTSFETES